MKIAKITTQTQLTGQFEGLRLKPYICPAGKLTIGYGRNLDDNGIRVEEAMLMLENDLKSARKQAQLNFRWFSDLSDIRQIVIVDMIYNMGLPRLLHFKKMIAALEQRNYRLAADEMIDSKWAIQVGHRAALLSLIMSTNKMS